MESQPQNPEFRIPENFHPYKEFIQAMVREIQGQGLPQNPPKSFKNYQFMKRTDLQIIIQLLKRIREMNDALV